MIKRIIAFDIGDKRIGVAISDPFGEYAMPCDTYFRTGRLFDDVNALISLAERENAEIVCGLPLNADGTPSVQTEKTERFLAALRQATSCPIYTVDERHTTQQARADLNFLGVSTKKDKRKKNVDSLAAAYILERYLAESKKGVTNMSMKEENYGMEEDDNIVELVDEDGNTLRYEHVGTIEYKGEWYCFFTPELTKDSDDEEEEVAVFHLVGDEDNETLEVVEDDALLDEVFAEFCNQYEYADEADEAMSLDADEE